MPEASDRRPVGVIGLGKMGSALARALLNHGYAVTVWNRTPSKYAPLKEAGADVAPSAEDAMRAASIVILCLTGPSASDGILHAPGVAALFRSKILVQLSTLPAEQSRDLDRWAHENGVEYLYGSIFGYPSDVVRAHARPSIPGPSARSMRIRASSPPWAATRNSRAKARMPCWR